MRHARSRRRRWGGAAIWLLAASSIVQAQESTVTGSDIDDRLVQQQKRIQELEKRLEQLETEAMGGVSDATLQAADPT